MRMIVLAMLALLLQTPGFCQQHLPAFGKISKADLEMTDCDFDSGAAAVKLIDHANVFYTHTTAELTSLVVMYERRIRIKILKPSAISLGNISIPYVSQLNTENIQGVKACTYNLVNGKEIRRTMVQKKGIFTRKINQVRSEVILVFPEIKTGSVIEFQYTVQSREPGMLKEWQFQTELPTRLSDFQVSLPPDFGYTVHPLTSDSLEIKETFWEDHFFLKSASASTRMHRKQFTMRNLPALPEEPLMSSARDYQQRLYIQLSAIDYGNGNTVAVNSDWEDVVTELLEDKDFGKLLHHPIKNTAPLVQQASTVIDTLGRMQLILNYIHQNLQWNGIESLYAEPGLNKTWEQKKGNSAALNLVLINLLKATGLQVSPVIFSTRANGTINKALPLIHQFNTLLARVQVNNQYFLLNAADARTPYWLTPEKIAGTSGFVIEKDSGYWITPTGEEDHFKMDMAVNGFVDSAGSMTGNVFFTGSGYARKEFMENWQGAGLFTEDQIMPNGMRLKVNAATTNSEINPVKALEEKATFQLKLPAAGARRYFTLNCLQAFGDNPFKAANRKTDIDFGYKQQYNIYGNFFLPPNFGYESVPAEMLLMMPDSSIIFKRFVNADNNTLNVRISLTFNKPVFVAASYPDVAAFYKLLLQHLNEAVIIKTKNEL